MQQYYDTTAAKCRKLTNCNGIIWLHGSLFALALAAQMPQQQEGGDSKTVYNGNLEVIGPVQFPVQRQPQHCQWQQKMYKFQQRKVCSFMADINCIFPGTLEPWCNVNCPFITLWHNNVANTILRSNIGQKLWPSKRIGEGSGYFMSAKCQVFHQNVHSLTRACFSARNTRVHCTYQGWPEEIREYSGKTN